MSENTYKLCLSKKFLFPPEIFPCISCSSILYETHFIRIPLLKRKIPLIFQILQNILSRRYHCRDLQASKNKNNLWLLNSKLHGHNKHFNLFYENVLNPILPQGIFWWGILFVTTQHHPKLFSFHWGNFKIMLAFAEP